MGGEARDLVAETLGRDNSLIITDHGKLIHYKHFFQQVVCTYDFIDDTLVGVEVESQTRIAVSYRFKQQFPRYVSI